MKKVVLVYDDTVKVNERIQTIIGNKSFGEMILKRKKLYYHFKDICSESREELIVKKVNNIESFFSFKNMPKDTIFLYIPSNFAVVNKEEFLIILEKMHFINKTTILFNNSKKVGIAFIDRDEFVDFINVYKNQENMDFIDGDYIDTKCFIDLTEYNNLLMYISSGFDARYFNSIQGDSYTVTKHSKNKKKMKMEYSYYWLLPEKMKNWIVMPFDYQETNDVASYTMERMPMTDIAIRWTHSAISIEEFSKILDKTFYFFNLRSEKIISKEEYIKNAESLYLKKVENRITDLKKTVQYETLSSLIKSGTDFDSIDEIIEKYKKLYKKITDRFYNNISYKSVIGHGDVFFANMLYSKEINLLRLIDPKGALTKDELWMDPYYDIAKLSHSICGNYDFFNTGSYDINLDKNMKLSLIVHFNNEAYINIFKQYLENNNYDYRLVRLYEASLFLSMLPLHIDNIHKVLGFVLNAINILKEVESYV